MLLYKYVLFIYIGYLLSMYIVWPCVYMLFLVNQSLATHTQSYSKLMGGWGLDSNPHPPINLIGIESCEATFVLIIDPRLHLCKQPNTQLDWVWVFYCRLPVHTNVCQNVNQSVINIECCVN